jgi:hypothetical protein
MLMLEFVVDIITSQVLIGFKSSMLFQKSHLKDHAQSILSLTFYITVSHRDE